MKTSFFRALNASYRSVCSRVSAAISAPTEAQASAALFILGVAILSFGLAGGAMAADYDGSGLVATYNDMRIANSVNMILTYMEGTFGALIMVAAGIGAILSAAFGQYRAALGCLVVAVGAFILRSFLGTFFNDINVQG